MPQLEGRLLREQRVDFVQRIVEFALSQQCEAVVQFGLSRVEQLGRCRLAGVANEWQCRKQNEQKSDHEESSDKIFHWLLRSRCSRTSR